MASFYECSGCGLCALVCPTWTQNSDISLLPWGRAKARQGGASAEELKDSLDSCIKCAACTPICPEKIDVQLEDQKLLQELGQDERPALSDSDWYDEKLLLSDSLKNENKLYALIRKHVHLHSRGNELVSDSLEWHQKLKREKSPHRLYSVGEWLIEKKVLHKKIKEGDLYWMDAPLFHNRYETLVKKYDNFKKQTKCQLNWNLQRTAMPLGEDNAHFSREKQYEWVLFNKKVNRIIAENIDDWKWLKANSQLPVVHVCELIGEN
jgi:Pyruvate/2-oxoacid:ferredoxin oxidoreductase delta subunit